MTHARGPPRPDAPEPGRGGRRTLRLLLLLVLAVAAGLLAWFAVRTVPVASRAGRWRAAEALGPAGSPDDGGAAAPDRTSPGGGTAEAGHGSGGVVGRVVLARDGSPAAGVAVRLARGEAEVHSATGDDGVFDFPAVPEGAGWVLTVDAPRGFADAVVPVPPVRDRRTADVGTIPIEPESGVRGAVVDEYGLPVAGAVVLVIERPLPVTQSDALRTIEGLRSLPASAGSTRTDAAGNFLFPVGAGEWLVCAGNPPTHATASERVTVAGPGTPPVRIVLPRGCRIEGRVTGPADLDLGRLRVHLAPEFEILATIDALAAVVTAQVAEDGTFAAEGLAAGDWTAAIDAGDWIAWSPRTSQAPGDVELHLPSAASLSGRVTGPGDAPVAGAWVAYVDDWLRFTRTGPDGTYRLPALERGTPHFFAVRATGLAPWPPEFDLAIRGPKYRPTIEDGPNVFDVRLVPGGSATGVVVARDTREPIAGADVRAASRYMLFGGWATAVTGADGRFSFRDLPCERTVFLAVCPGWAQADALGAMKALGRQDDAAPASVATPAVDEAPDLRIEMVPAPVLRGRVLSPGGDPVGGATVGVVLDAGRRPESSEAGAYQVPAVLSAADGTFAVALPLVPETGVVEARAPGWHAGREEFAGAPPDLVEVRLAPGTTVEGTVTDEDGPVAGADVECRGERRSGDDVTLRAVTGDDGAFRFEDLAPGHWTVRVSEPHHVGDSTSVHARGAAARADFVLAPAIVVWGVVLRPDGSPAAGAEVRIVAAGGGVSEELVAGRDGTFSFSEIPVGRWTVVAQGGAFAPSEPVEVEGDTDGLEVHLVASRSISGTLRWEGDGPAAEVFVLARPRGSNVVGALGTSVARSGADGSFEVAQLPAGEYDLRIASWNQDDDRAFAGPRSARAGARDVDLVVVPGREIAGTLLRDDGSPAAGVVLDGEPAGDLAEVAASEEPHVERTAVTGEAAADGSFRFRRLAPGPWRVSARDRDARTATVTVAAGDRGVRLRLCPGCTVRGRVVLADGSPVVQAEVHASTFDTGRRVGGAPTDESGRFTIGPVPCGRTRFSLDRPRVLRPPDRAVPAPPVPRAPGPRAADVTRDLVHGEQAEEVVLTLPPPPPDDPR